MINLTLKQAEVIEMNMINLIAEIGIEFPTAEQLQQIEAIRKSQRGP